MKALFRPVLSSRYFTHPARAFVAAFALALVPLAAHGQNGCVTQCEPGPGSNEGYVTSSPVPNSTTWNGTVPTPTPTQSATPAISFSGEDSTPVDKDETLGWTFTVPAGQSIVVSSLGVWDGPSASDSPAPGDGLGEDHQVTIWDSNGNAVAQTTVLTTDPEDANNFVYHTLGSSVTLSEGTYTIGVYYSSSNVDPVAQSAAGSIATPLTFNGSAANTGNQQPAQDSTQFSYFGPNFQFQVGPSSNRALSFNSDSASNTGTTTGTVGWQFTVNTTPNRPVTVTALGVWDSGGDGLADSHDVAIWNANGDLLVTATVPSGTPAPADDLGFRYVTVTPTSLVNGTYFIGANYPDSNDSYISSATNITTDPRLTYRTGANYNGGFADPFINQAGANTNGFGGYFGPNFQLQAETAKDQYLVDVQGNHDEYRGLEVDVTITPNDAGEDFDVYVYEAVPAATPTPTPTGTVGATRNIPDANGNNYKEGPLVAFAAHRNGDPESVSFVPSELGTGIYLVDVYYTSGIKESGPNTYTGSATVNIQGTLPISASPAPSPTYTTSANGGSIKFGPNITVKAPFAPADGNPQDRTDVEGNHYTGGMRGRPPGADLWYIDLRPMVNDPANPGNQIANPNYDPNTRVPLYRPNVGYLDHKDSQTINQFDDYLALAVGFGGNFCVDNKSIFCAQTPVPFGFGTAPALALSEMFTSLEFPNTVRSTNSLDLGNDTEGYSPFNQTFDRGYNPPLLLGVDQNGHSELAAQQWEEFLRTTSVYLTYRTRSFDDSFSGNGPGGNGATGEVFVHRSDNAGRDFNFTYDSSTDSYVQYPPINTGVATGRLAAVDVEQSNGSLYEAGSTGSVLVGTVTTPQMVFHKAVQQFVNGVPPSPDTWSVYHAATDPNGVAHALFVTKVADDAVTDSQTGAIITPATVYGVYSNGADIFLVSSADGGQTWSNPIRVNSDATQTNLFPWIETSPTVKGTVGIVWYATANTPANNPTPSPTIQPVTKQQAETAERQGNNANADWKVYFAQVTNALGGAPAVEIAEVTEPQHYVHSGSIFDEGYDPSTQELGILQPESSNHNLFDYIQLSFDPRGAAIVSYTDDHNDYRGNIYIARQIAGPGIDGSDLSQYVDSVSGKPKEGESLAAPTPCQDVPFFLPTPAPNDPCYSFPPSQPDPQTKAQVTDFAYDQGCSSFEDICGDKSWDIRTVRYGSTGAAGNLSIFSAMTVTDLTQFDPSGPTDFVQAWRMSFSVNPKHADCPLDNPQCDVSATDPSTGQYSFALSDRGDQFYVEARVNPAFFFLGFLVGGQPFDFVWGVATRNSDGSLTFSELGKADYGFVSFDTNTIYVQIGVDKINGWLTPIGHPPVGNHTLVAGLRGRTLFDRSAFFFGIGAPTPGTPTRNFSQDRDGNPTAFFGTFHEDVIDETRGGTEFMIVDSAAPGTTVQFASASYTVNEGDGKATLTVTRTGDTSGGSTVHYATSDDSATAGQDYTPTSGDLTFAPGETTQTIQVPIIDDTVVEGTEDFFVTLSNPVGANLGAPSQAIVYITDNDTSPTPTPSASPAIVDFDEAEYDVNEGDGNAIVTVSRSGNTSTTVTVNYATSDDTAKSPMDYTSTSGTLTFGPGVTSQVIKIPIIDDNAHENTEDFFVALSNPSSNASIGSPSQTVVVIHDNDSAATPTPSASPSPSGTPGTVELLNISARALVQTGDAVAVGGFIVRGDSDTTKRIVVRGLGPSLPTSNDLQDPVLELHEANGATIEINDNWAAGPHSTDVAAAGLAPTDPRESAIYRVLPPGSYTAVLHGANNGTGIGLVEVYDLDASSTNYLADLSSRAFVSTGDNALIDGLILRGGAPQRIMLRAIGPDLQTERDVSGALQDPTLELHDANGTLIAFNDDWRSDQENEIIATGLAPHDDRDAALLRTLSAGNYTAIVRGKAGTTGVALGEIYNLGNP
jgi:hypothetical protein